jgi:hypothetical protein
MKNCFVLFLTISICSAILSGCFSKGEEGCYCREDVKEEGLKKKELIDIRLIPPEERVKNNKKRKE